MTEHATQDLDFVRSEEMAEATAEDFNELKDRLIAATGSPGFTSFHDGKVHMTISEWERLIKLIEAEPTSFGSAVIRTKRDGSTKIIDVELESSKEEAEELVARQNQKIEGYGIKTSWAVAEIRIV